ncbi:NEW3 domain-containing protein [Streptomyces sp. NPDC020917]|uniref:NEW3 domain-containing protein n=1 Tax=Streptomyces sp. NPDC020917 TaxID=3365102 RepID=UPI0037AFC2D1
MRSKRSTRLGGLVAAATTAALLAAGTLTAQQAGAEPATPSAADPWVLTSTTYSPADYTQEPFVGNGYLAQRLPAIGAGFEGNGDLGTGNWPLGNPRSTTAIVAGVYQTSGKSDSLSTLPSWSDLSFDIDGHVLDAKVPASQISQYRQTLDMHSGTVTTSFVWTPETGRSATVTYQVLANRERMHLGQVRATISPSWSGSVSVTSLLNGAGVQRITPTSRSVDTGTDTATVQLSTPGRATAVAQSARLVADHGVTVSQRSAVLPDDNAGTAGERWTVPVHARSTYGFTKYVGISTSNDPGAPAQEALATVDQAEATGWNPLTSAHKAQWAQLWDRRVTVKGQPSVQTAVDSSFYLLYSSLRAGVNFSIPPAGLSSDNYAGVIFWDADTWMFPSLLALHPELAKSIVTFRHDTMAAAEANARGAGYRGGSWAWDNGPSGTCGGLAPCQGYEDHLQSDIALAQWQYYQATGDTAWLRSDGYPVIKDVADFWASRVTAGSDGKLHINHVTGPDEFTSGVNDESATNAGAVVALRDAVAAAKAVGATPDPAWSTVAEKIFIATDADGTHPEYPGYTNQKVKQADTVLMTYPFGYVTDPATASADLERYLQVTDTGGPAMTASVEAIVAAQAQQPGCLDYTLFLDSYQPFLRGAYQQFNETQYLTPSAGQSNPAFDFATGAGGFLQTLLYGFTGLRWDASSLNLAPTLPPQLARGVSITGLQYQGRTVDVTVGAKATTVALASGAALELRSAGSTHKLVRGQQAVLPTARPDLAPTDNLARCQTATATSAGAVNPPAAAVDGSTATAWTATSTDASLTVALDQHAGTAHGPATVGHADLAWGSTRPASYTVQAQASSGTWRQVAAGAVPATGDLDATWPAVRATALKFTFSGGGPASIVELTTPDAAAADVITTLDAPQSVAPGTSADVTLTAKSIGGADATGVKAALSLPDGWTASPAAAPGTIARGSTATYTWTVTAPAGASPSQAPVTATTTWQGAAGTSSTVATATVYVGTPAQPGTPLQAESAILSGGASVARDHPGYTGTGFVANLYTGAAVTGIVTVPAAGRYQVGIRYANWTGGQSAPYLTETRTISLTAGGSTQQVQLPVTGSWDTWSTVTAEVSLPAGTSTVQLAVGPDDSGSVNLDSLQVG